MNTEIKQIQLYINKADISELMEEKMEGITHLLYNLVDLHMESNQIDLAIHTLKQGLILEPWNWSLMDDIGRLAILNEQFDEGIEYLKEAFSTQGADDGGVSEYYLNPICTAYIAVGKISEIKEYIEEVINSNGYHGEGNYLVHFAKVVDQLEYELALKKIADFESPDSVDLICEYGELLLQKQELQLARKTFKCALKLKPNDSWAISGLLLCMIRIGELEKAGKLVKKFPASYEKDFFLLRAISEFQFHMNNYGEALLSITKCIDALINMSVQSEIEFKKIAPMNEGRQVWFPLRITSPQMRIRNTILSHSFLLKADILVALNRFSEASSILDSARELFPEIGIFYEYGAIVNLKINDLENAQKIMIAADNNRINFPDEARRRINRRIS